MTTKPPVVYPNDTHLSPNLTWAEMRCNCGKAQMTPEQVKNAIAYAKVWQKVRDKYGKPIHINCGHRCPTCNLRVGGAKYSQHLYARAADCRGDNNTVEEAILIAKAALLVPEVRGVSVYGAGHGNFCHIDNRVGPRWYAVNGGYVAADGEARLRRWVAAGKEVK